jgi:hypothetical protein
MALHLQGFFIALAVSHRLPGARMRTASPPIHGLTKAGSTAYFSSASFQHPPINFE